MKLPLALVLGIALWVGAGAAWAAPTESVIYGLPEKRPPPRPEARRPPPRPSGEEDKPGEGARPADGAKPGEGARPADGAKPGEGARPADGAKPGEGARPGAAPPPKVPPRGKAQPARPRGHMPWGRPEGSGDPGASSAAGAARPGGARPGQSGVPARPGEAPPRMLDLDPSKTPGMGFTIVGVRVIGNKKTNKNVILNAAQVPIGERLTVEVRDRIQRNLLACGLLRRADVHWEVVKDRQGEVTLFLSVKEKITWFVAPNFSYADGQYGGSVAFGDRNLGGIGKQLRIHLGYNTEAQRVAVRYKDPNIAFTPWGWEALVGYTRSLFKDYDPSEQGIRRGRLLRQQTYQRLSAELDVSYRWYHWVTTGLRYRFGLVDIEEPLCLRASPTDPRTLQRCPTAYEGLDPGPLGRTWYVGPEAFLDDHGLWADHTGQRAKFWNWRRDAGAVLFAEVSRMQSVHGMEHGFAVTGELSVNHRYLGGSFDYTTWRAEYDQALSFGRNPEFGARHTLAWHVEHGQTYNAPYFREPRVGGTDLRGFISQQFVGDTLTRATLQYKVHLFRVGWFMVRAVAFWDTAWLFFREGGGPDAILREQGDFRRVLLPQSPGPSDLRGWHNGLGAGLRLYVKGISFGTIGVDFAYGIESNRVRFVVMVGS